MLNSAQRRKLRTRRSVKSNNKGNRPRLVVNRSNKNIYAQLISVDGNVILQSSSLKIDKKITGIEKAKEVGKLFAENCVKAKIIEVVFDKGSYEYGGRVKALAEICRQNGLKF